MTISFLLYFSFGLSSIRLNVSRCPSVCSKCFVVPSLQSVRAVGEKKKKKSAGLFLGGRKNTLLKTLVAALACAVFKSVFFVGGFLIWFTNT